jgi:CheY-like chemotaxis protein
MRTEAGTHIAHKCRLRIALLVVFLAPRIEQALANRRTACGDRFREHGIDHYLTKPIRREELEQVLSLVAQTLV